MAPLILALWRLGFETGASCESFPPLNRLVASEDFDTLDGYAYVAFTNEEDRDLFERAVQSVASDRLVVSDVSPDITDEDAALHAAWMVGFPHVDIPAVTTAVERGRSVVVSEFAIGTRVRIKDTYRDEERTQPVTGTVEDVFSSPDYRDGAEIFVVMFEDGDGPPGGEFTVDRLEREDGRLIRDARVVMSPY